MDDQQFEKLPAYAKREIERLREQVERLRAKNDWLEDENRHKVAKSNTWLSEGLNENTALPPYSNVEFQLAKDSKHMRSTVTVRLNRENVLEIMGGDSIVVYPKSSNYVCVKLAE